MSYTSGSLKYLNRIMAWAGNSLAVLMLLLMALIPCLELIGRRFFGFGISGATDYLQHLTLWLCLFGAVLAVRDNKHLRIVGKLDFFPRYLQFFSSWPQFIAASVCWALCGASIQLITAEAPAVSQAAGRMLPDFIVNWLGPFGLFDPGGAVDVGGWIPRWIAESILPGGFAAIALSYIICSTKNNRIWPKLIIALSLPFVIMLSIVFPVAPAAVIYIGFAVLIISVLFGAPIFVFLGGARMLLI
jgi:TRAP-type C4-dicarboxylate transport system permease small subunit